MSEGVKYAPTLPESGLLIQELWTGSGEGICITKVDGTIRYANPAFARIAGQEISALEGQSLNSLFRPADESAPPGNPSFLNNHKPLEGRFVLPDGRALWLSVSVRSLKLPDDRDVTLYFFRNTTRCREKELQTGELQKKNAELSDKLDHIRNINNELEAACNKAEAKEKEKSGFLANLSHEIRTPMNGILGFTEMLRRQDLSMEKRDQYLQIIEQSGHRMLNIIDDIIDLSKIEAGLVRLKPEQTNLNTLLQQLHAFFLPEAEKADLSFNLDIPEYNDVAANLSIDRQKLEQVISNLINNALKFTAKGQIDIGYNLEGNVLNIFVRDTGPGIPAGNHQDIFKRFWKRDMRPKKIYEGSGLGLAISKSFVELMDGKLWLESEEGKGTCFWVTIPITSKP